jgi:hypothetical protein
VNAAFKRVLRVPRYWNFGGLRDGVIVERRSTSRFSLLLMHDGYDQRGEAVLFAWLPSDLQGEWRGYGPPPA